MLNKDVKAIAGSIAKEVVQRSEHIDKAKEIIKSEIDKYDSLELTQDEENGVIIITGVKYGRAVIDLNVWFQNINPTYLPENIARDMMEDVHNQLFPAIKHLL
jgi:hypothetical protein